MKSIKKVLLYGFLLWLVPFIISFLMYPLKSSNRVLWESIMSVVIAIAAVIFSILYLANLQTNFLKEAALIGIIWLAISIILDLFLFMEGSMKMPAGEYIMDIGLTYLMIPVICIGFGYLLQKKRENSKE